MCAIPQFQQFHDLYCGAQMQFQIEAICFISSLSQGSKKILILIDD